MQVYIEDTDAYGIMYNSNYLRCYDRALHMTSYAHNSKTDLACSSVVLQHDDEWSIVSFERMKFKTAPALGTSFVIAGRLVEQPSPHEQVWDMQMQCDQDESLVYNTIEGVRIAHLPSDGSSTDWIPHPNAFAVDKRSPKAKTAVTTCSKNTFQIYRDEFDPHLSAHLPLRNVLNLLERSRTNLLGGPDGLRRLQQDHDVRYVVTRVDDCSLVSTTAVSSSSSSSSSHNNNMIAGESLAVETEATIKRGGGVIVFHQTARLGTERVAQAIVSICALNEHTRRPTNKLPFWMKEKLLSGGETV